MVLKITSSSPWRLRGWSIGDNCDEQCFNLSVRGNNGWVDVTKPDAKA